MTKKHHDDEATVPDHPEPPPPTEPAEPPPEVRVCTNPSCAQLAFEGQELCARCKAPTKKA